MKLSRITASPTRWRRRRGPRSICSQSVWTPGVLSARKEQEALQAIVAAEGGNFEVAPWDWRYFAEKRRKAEFDFDEGEIKPYLQLDRLIEAAFYAADRLFGLSFAERFDLKLYHPDARAWTVRGHDGEPIALFIGDYFARASKRSGAWMSQFRGQKKLDGPQLADRRQCDEFRQGWRGRAEPAEFRRRAHAFSRIRPCPARHAVRRDLSPDLRHACRAAISSNFPRSSTRTGWNSPKCCAASRCTTRPASRCRRRCSTSSSARAGSTRASRPSNMRPRRWSTSSSISTRRPTRSTSSPSSGRSSTGSACRTRSRCVTARRISSTSFRHGYSSGYYCYLWSEVLDADGFDAFEESGDIFDPATGAAAARFRLRRRRQPRLRRGLRELSRPRALAARALPQARLRGLRPPRRHAGACAGRAR